MNSRVKNLNLKQKDLVESRIEIFDSRPDLVRIIWEKENGESAVKDLYVTEKASITIDGGKPVEIPASDLYAAALAKKNHNDAKFLSLQSFEGWFDDQATDGQQPTVDLNKTYTEIMELQNQPNGRYKIFDGPYLHIIGSEQHEEIILLPQKNETTHITFESEGGGDIVTLPGSSKNYKSQVHLDTQVGTKTTVVKWNNDSTNPNQNKYYATFELIGDVDIQYRAFTLGSFDRSTIIDQWPA